MMTKRRSTGAAATAAALLVLAACGGDDGSAEEPEAEAPAEETEAPMATTITYAEEQEYTSYNGNTAEENAAKNNTIIQQVRPSFWTYGVDGNPMPNPEFGTYEKVSDDPLTVEATINEEAVWSDGTPIDCDDILLWWTRGSGNFPDFSTPGTTGTELVAVPDCAAGDKTFTSVFSEPYADWAADGVPGDTTLLPAHVLEEQVGLTEEELIDAVKSGDQEALADAAEFHNTGWIFDGALPDPSLIPSSGPYKIDSYDPGQSITLTANENYWGDPPLTETVVVRFIPQEEQVQALANGEVDIIQPQPNPDVLSQLEGVQGIHVEPHDQFIYEHLDFNFDSSPFADRQLREAFAKCVPRKLIVDNLIKPVNPEAVVMDVRNVQPFQPIYSEVAEGSGAEAYAEPDIEGAAQILQETGNEGLEVKIGYIVPNQRRTNTVQLIADSCGQAGFNIVDQGAENFFDDGGGLSENTYDVALFGWFGSALVSGWSSTYSTPDECTPSAKGNNNGCYSNPQVDDLIEQLNATSDVDAQTPLIAEIEQILWADLATIPLFAHPGMVAWREGVEGVTANPSQASYPAHAHEWSVSQ